MLTDTAFLTVMHKKPVRFLLLLGLCVLSVGTFGQRRQLATFPLSTVRLLPGPFQVAQQTDLDYMLKLNPDRLLAPFRREAGLPSLVASYENWENTGLDGHIGGHYLTALAQMVAATGNPEARQRLTYMVSVLDTCQQRSGDGYVGGIPGGKAMWREIAQGHIDAGTFSLNKKWVPLYNIHKLFAGLRDAYRLAGNQRAKTMLIRLTDWMQATTANLTEAQLQDMLRSEHGGLNEIFADVAGMTGNRKYLTLARRFSDRSTLTPLLASQDKLNGLHANMQIPKVIGYLRVADQANDKAWADAADFFWQTVVKHRTVSIGGNSVREHFHPATNFSSMVNSVEGPETCNSYNMLKLTEDLFLDRPSAQYIDYYERTLYNHILSSQRPVEGGFVYFTPMRPQHYRVYSQPQDGFWCCVGSGMENHGKYGELIYAHGTGQHASDLYVNLFIPSTLTWADKGLTLTQQTDFPFTEKTDLTLRLKKPARFALKLRAPAWANGMQVLVNNKVVAAGPDAQSYVTVDRTWKTGDRVTLSLPMTTTAEVLPDSSAWVSFLHGPIVLGAATDDKKLDGLNADASRMGHIASGPQYPLAQAPLLVSTRTDFASAVQAVPGKPLTFTVSKLIHQDKFKGLTLQPFFQIQESRYVVYWPYTTPSGIDSTERRLRQNDELTLTLERTTVDKVAPGEQQPESDHNFQGEQTETGVFRDVHFRRATGWFSYDLKNKNKAAKKLRVTYHGADKNQSFNLYLNGTLLKTVAFEKETDASFFEEDYALPDALRQADTITVRFEAAKGATAGNIYDVRLMK